MKHGDLQLMGQLTMDQICMFIALQAEVDEYNDRYNSEGGMALLQKYERGLKKKCLMMTVMTLLHLLQERKEK